MSETVEIIIKGRDEASDAFRQVRKEMLRTRLATSTLRMYYKQQHEELTLALSAYGSFVYVLRQTQTMYMQYNMALIRVENIQQRITRAQDRYNEALQRFGAGSLEARDAAQALANAQRDLEMAQMQNNLMIAGFIMQVPYFVKGVVDMIDKVRVLTATLQAAAVMRALAEYGPIVGGALAAGVIGAGVGYTAARARAGGGGIVIQSMRVEMSPRGQDPEEAAADLFQRLQMRLRASRPEV